MTNVLDRDTMFNIIDEMVWEFDRADLLVAAIDVYSKHNGRITEYQFRNEVAAGARAEQDRRAGQWSYRDNYG